MTNKKANKKDRYQKLLEKKLKVLHSEEWDYMSEEEQDILSNEVLDLQDYLEERIEKPEYEQIEEKLDKMSWQEIAKMSPEEHRKLWELRQAIGEAREEDETKRIEKLKREALQEVLEERAKPDRRAKTELTKEEQEKYFKRVVEKTGEE